MLDDSGCHCWKFFKHPSRVVNDSDLRLIYRQPRTDRVWHTVQNIHRGDKVSLRTYNPSRELSERTADDVDYLQASAAALRCEHPPFGSMAWHHSPRLRRATCLLKS